MVSVGGTSAHLSLIHNSAHCCPACRLQSRSQTERLAGEPLAAVWQLAGSPMKASDLKAASGKPSGS